MTALHPDSAIIDRIGIPAIRKHFDLSRQAVHYWRRKGVPNEHRRDVMALGRRAGLDVSEMKIKTDRKRGRPATSGQSPASSVTPA